MYFADRGVRTHVTQLVSLHHCRLSTIGHLQCMQNAAVRVILGLLSHDHIHLWQRCLSFEKARSLMMCPGLAPSEAHST